MKVLPSPGSLSAVMNPLCASTMRCTIDKTQAAALGAGRVEGIEDAILFLGGDADAGVGKGEPQEAVAGGGGYRQVPAIGHRLYGIGDQVHENLFQPVLVGADLGQPIRAVRLTTFDVLLFGELFGEQDDLAENTAGVHRPETVTPKACRSQAARSRPSRAGRSPGP